MTKVAINGLGRIGRILLKRILRDHHILDVVAINDLADTKTLAHLLKFDSIYGIYEKSVKSGEDSLFIDGNSKGRVIKVFKEADPSKLPWKELGIDIVLECTGFFRDMKGAKKHIDAGAKKVIISAPAKDPEIPSYVLGVNEENIDLEKNDIIDMASCTTNCLGPVAKVLNENFRIKSGLMTTIHSYTSDQRLLDLPHRDFRRARAAAVNMIPTTTGATKALGKILPELNGKLKGMAIRVPTPTVSIVDLVCEVEKATTSQEVNFIFKKASHSSKLKGILGIEDAQLVSSDYAGNSFSAIVDSSLTMAEGNLIKTIAWYDNEYAYACRLAEFAEYISKKL